MARFYIRPRLPRPDFRLVVTFLWGDFHSVDTEGDSYNPASRDWNHLYCQNREQESEHFEVHPVQADPLVLEIASECRRLAARVTYFLALETASGFAPRAAGPFAHPDTLRGELGADFDLAAAEQRAAASCWRRSTLEKPYPNLEA